MRRRKKLYIYQKIQVFVFFFYQNMSRLLFSGYKSRFFFLYDNIIIIIKLPNVYIHHCSSIHSYDYSFDSMALNSSSSKDFKFTLKDHELLRFLYNKIYNKSLPNYITILEYDLFGTLKNPWDIWEEFGASCSYCEKDLYFFTTTNSKVVRSIGIGAWEGEEDTGKIIVSKNKNQLIGVKKCFRFENSGTYHDGEWILHEYSLDKSLIRNPLVSNVIHLHY